MVSGAHGVHIITMTHAVAAAMMVTSLKVVPHSLIAARISLTTSSWAWGSGLRFCSTSHLRLGRLIGPEGPPGAFRSSAPPKPVTHPSACVPAAELLRPPRCAGVWHRGSHARVRRRPCCPIFCRRADRRADRACANPRSTRFWVWGSGVPRRAVGFRESYRDGRCPLAGQSPRCCWPGSGERAWLSWRVR